MALLVFDWEKRVNNGNTMRSYVEVFPHRWSTVLSQMLASAALQQFFLRSVSLATICMESEHTRWLIWQRCKYCDMHRKRSVKRYVERRRKKHEFR